jgi:hypothetical protein
MKILKKGEQKEQRATRLTPALNKRIDDYAKAMGVSYNYVVETCIGLGLPVMFTSEYYEARLKGMTDDQLRAGMVKVMKDHAKGR